MTFVFVYIWGLARLKWVGFGTQTHIDKTMKYFQGVIPRAANDRVSELMVPSEAKEQFTEEAQNLPAVNISTLDLQWVQVLGEGWASPLKGKSSEFILLIEFTLVNL